MATPNSLIVFIIMTISGTHLLNCGSFLQEEQKKYTACTAFYNTFRQCAPQTILQNIQVKKLPANKRSNTLKKISKLQKLNAVVEDIIYWQHTPQIIANKKDLDTLESDGDSYKGQEINEFVSLHEQIQTILNHPELTNFLLKKKKTQVKEPVQTIYKTGRTSLLRAAVNDKLQDPFQCKHELEALHCTILVTMKGLAPNTSQEDAEDFTILFRLDQRIKNKLEEVAQTNDYLEAWSEKETLRATKKACLAELVSVVKNRQREKRDYISMAELLKKPHYLSHKESFNNHGISIALPKISVALQHPDEDSSTDFNYSDDQEQKKYSSEPLEVMALKRNPNSPREEAILFETPLLRETISFAQKLAPVVECDDPSDDEQGQELTNFSSSSSSSSQSSSSDSSTTSYADLDYTFFQDQPTENGNPFMDNFDPTPMRSGSPNSENGIETLASDEEEYIEDNVLLENNVLSASAPLPESLTKRATVNKETRSSSTPEAFKPTPSRAASWFSLRALTPWKKK